MRIFKLGKINVSDDVKIRHLRQNEFFFVKLEVHTHTYTHTHTHTPTE
jgi:hypothetical protein